MPEWRNGKRSRLKIDRRKACEFESHLRHTLETPQEYFIFLWRSTAKKNWSPSVFQRSLGELPSNTRTSPRPPSGEPLGFPNLPPRRLVLNSRFPTPSR